MRAVPSKSCGLAAVTTAAHRRHPRVRFLPRRKCRSTRQRRCGGIVPSNLFVGRHRPGLRRGPGRNAVATVTVLGPCVLLLQDHTHGGLVFIVNPGSGTAALHFVSRRLGLLHRNRPARQISPTCSLPRETNFSGLPVLHCVAAPSLRYGVRRARTLTHRITPRPRWARPG
jgi:hypothetical protein